ncbi:hypothetical protein SORBI_3001G287301 [Sorghum bicolor]|uniref:Uncharacterized protein n=1 Tax=Sorghum bicolor TaxID=4558 RepID=A0A1Z5S816_SORBI|nr:hypothetical protein SORBI_3001G287301 [Sorghum bicolor]
MAAVARRKRRKLARSRHAPPLPLPWCQIQKVVVERGGSGDSLASKTHRGSPSTWTRELPVMLEASRSRGAANAATWDFFAAGEGSHKVSLGGDFSIQLLPWMGCKLLVCLDRCLELKRFFLEHCYYEVIDSLRLTWMMPTSVRKNALKRWSFFS